MVGWVSIRTGILGRLTSITLRSALSPARYIVVSSGDNVSFPGPYP